MGKKSKKKVTKQAAKQAANQTTGPVRAPPQATESTRPSASRASTCSNTRTRRAGMTNPFKPTTQAELEAIRSPPVTSSSELDPEKAPEDATCWICLEGPSDGNEEALRRNCACRGKNGWSHLSCLSKFCSQRSEDIWTGKRSEEGMTHLSMGRPWESCSNCKQWFSGKWRVDIAAEFKRSTEGMVNGLRVFRHVTAVAWMTKSLLSMQGSFELLIEDEFSKLFSLIEDAKAVYVHTVSNAVVDYLQASLGQLLVEAHSNYAMFISSKLTLAYQCFRGSDSEYDRMKSLYHKCRKHSKLASTVHDTLFSTMLTMDSFMNRQLEVTKVQLNAQEAGLENQFAAFFAEGKPGDDSEKKKQESREKELELLRQKYEHHRDMKIGGANVFSHGSEYLQRLIVDNTENTDHYLALDLALKMLRESRQVLGSIHPLHKSAKFNFGMLVTKYRRGQICGDPMKRMSPITRYEGDIDMYVLKMEDEGLIDKFGAEIAKDPEDVTLHNGALVKCVGLNKAEHLNEKRGWIAGYDDKKERHLVKFEDKSLKQALVKPANIRVLFFDDEEPDWYEKEMARAATTATEALDADEEETTRTNCLT